MNSLARVLGSAAIAALLVLAPLWGQPARMLDPGPLLAFLGSAVLYFTQPPFPKLQRLVRDGADRLSAVLIMIAVNVTMAVGAIEFALDPTRQPHPVSIAIGALLMTAAVALRVWAIGTLGPFFTATVQTSEDHALVDRGPYAHIRHPSYTGIVVGLVGVSLMLASSWTAVLTFCLVVPAYLYRIRVEEKVLVARFGEVYLRYRARAGALIPGL